MSHLVLHLTIVSIVRQWLTIHGGRQEDQLFVDLVLRGICSGELTGTTRYAVERLILHQMILVGAVAVHAYGSTVSLQRQRARHDILIPGTLLGLDEVAFGHASGLLQVKSLLLVHVG